VLKFTPLLLFFLTACNVAMSPQEIAERQAYCAKAGAKQSNVIFIQRTKDVVDVRCVFGEYETPSRNCFEQRKAGGKC
jgi:hypothetical protein